MFDTAGSVRQARTRCRSGSVSSGGLRGLDLARIEERARISGAFGLTNRGVCLGVHREQPRVRIDHARTQFRTVLHDLVQPSAALESQERECDRAQLLSEPHEFEMDQQLGYVALECSD